MDNNESNKLKKYFDNGIGIIITKPGNKSSLQSATESIKQNSHSFEDGYLEIRKENGIAVNGSVIQYDPKIRWEKQQKQDSDYLEDVTNFMKLNYNCPDSEKNGTGPGSCGGNKPSDSLENFKLGDKPAKSRPTNPDRFVETKLSNNIAPELSNKITSVVSNAYKNIPELNGTPLTTKNVSEKEYPELKNAFAAHDSNNIYLNDKYFSNINELEQKLSKEVESGFHPKGCNTVESIITHELGHLLFDGMAIRGDEKWDKISDVIQESKESGELGKVSKYALSEAGNGKLSEAASEIFASIFHTKEEEQEPVVKKVKNILFNKFNENSSYLEDASDFIKQNYKCPKGTVDDSNKCDIEKPIVNIPIPNKFKDIDNVKSDKIRGESSEFLNQLVQNNEYLVNSLKSYTNIGHLEVNKYLGNRISGNIPKETEKIIIGLDSIFNLQKEQNFLTSSSITTYRGVSDIEIENLLGLNQKHIYDIEPGKIITDPKFVSTTLNKEQALQFGRDRYGGSIITILIPKNSEALHTESVSGSEDELLINRNQSYKFLGVNKNIDNSGLDSNKPVHEFIFELVNANQKQSSSHLSDAVETIKQNYKCPKGTIDDSNKCVEDSTSESSYVNPKHEKWLYDSEDALNELDKINSDIRSEVIQKNKNGEDDTYNCLGLVARISGLESKLDWVDSSEMDTMLLEKATKIEKDDLSYGDILVYRDDDGEIEHIGINVDTKNEYVLSKAGSEPIQIDDYLNPVGYDYGSPNEFYKIKQKQDSSYLEDVVETIKLNYNCPDSEKNGTGPGSCGGSNTSSNKPKNDIVSLKEEQKAIKRILLDYNRLSQPKDDSYNQLSNRLKEINKTLDIETPKSVSVDITAPSRSALEKMIQGDPKYDDDPLPWDEDYNVKLGGTLYQIRLEGWYDDCLESRGYDKIDPDKYQDVIQSDFKQIVSDESGWGNSKKNIYGYVPNVPGTTYGVTYIGRPIKTKQNSEYLEDVTNFIKLNYKCPKGTVDDTNACGLEGQESKTKINDQFDSTTKSIIANLQNLDKKSSTLEHGIVWQDNKIIETKTGEEFSVGAYSSDIEKSIKDPANFGKYNMAHTHPSGDPSWRTLMPSGGDIEYAAMYGGIQVCVTKDYIYKYEFPNNTFVTNFPDKWRFKSKSRQDRESEAKDFGVQWNQLMKNIIIHDKEKGIFSDKQYAEKADKVLSKYAEKIGMKYRRIPRT